MSRHFFEKRHQPVGFFVDDPSQIRFYFTTNIAEACVWMRDGVIPQKKHRLTRECAFDELHDVAFGIDFCAFFNLFEDKHRPSFSYKSRSPVVYALGARINSVNDDRDFTPAYNSLVEMSTIEFSLECEIPTGFFIRVCCRNGMERPFTEELKGLKFSQLDSLDWETKLRDILVTFDPGEFKREEIEFTSDDCSGLVSRETCESIDPGFSTHLLTSNGTVSCGFFAKENTTALLRMVTVSHFTALNEKVFHGMNGGGHELIGEVVQWMKGGCDFSMISIPTDCQVLQNRFHVGNVSSISNKLVSFWGFHGAQCQTRFGYLEKFVAFEPTRKDLSEVALIFKEGYIKFHTESGDCGGLYVTMGMRGLQAIGIHTGNFRKENGTTIKQGVRLHSPALLPIPVIQQTGHCTFHAPADSKALDHCKKFLNPLFLTRKNEVCVSTTTANLERHVKFEFACGRSKTFGYYGVELTGTPPCLNFCEGCLEPLTYDGVFRLENHDDHLCYTFDCFKCRRRYVSPTGHDVDWKIENF